ncbi:OPT oligopeptide transporter protein [Poriferisphaera corsica]|uniref:OPT oligopeptide transporter protein n=1 Tax=Poriferisphaera corsica TaxID=2528020 RepID=A0A517YYF5_9BACT|nr:oligopeptide transporter, OPT family [Poriferisphaera corsica]QDU35262.1 OPT oligopeptide transporter protein [Poriferisphaera corsica]
MAMHQHDRGHHKNEPYIPASASLTEITVRAILLGISLSILLGAANVYLGLKAGITVAASIPAAVVSMAVLKMFKNSNILENNIVQTAASAGESLAAGVIFTIPALVILGIWDSFHYWETTLIAALGGVIGVFFTVPLRRSLIEQNKLQYPEGVATAEVLKVGDQGAGAKSLLGGGIIGALFKLGDSGFRLWTGIWEFAKPVQGSVFYFGINLSPALIAVGYIVGLNIATLVFIGGAINWLVAIPIYVASNELPEKESMIDLTYHVWSTKTRYIGVGAMVAGGLWALIQMRGSLFTGVIASMEAYRQSKLKSSDQVMRTSRDIPIQWIGLALLFSLVPLVLIYIYIVEQVPLALGMAVMMLIAGFLFSAISAYMAGLVGSSNNPVSGVTIATILFASLLLLGLGMGTSKGPAAALLIGAVVCCAAAIGGDNMQDLKSGYIVGATPWKQQIMQLIGVIAGALVMAPVLTLLLKAYGIGPITVEGQKPLAAPQSELMASVAQGVFAKNLPWNFIIAGIAVAIAVIIADLILAAKKASFRMPVLAVAVGLYLPFELSTSIFLGGLVAAAAGLCFRRRRRNLQSNIELTAADHHRDSGMRRGLLFAAGLITGEALLGILLAIPIVLYKGINPLDFGLSSLSAWPGIILLAIVLYLLYQLSTKHAKE